MCSHCKLDCYLGAADAVDRCDVTVDQDWCCCFANCCFDRRKLMLQNFALKVLTLHLVVAKAITIATEQANPQANTTREWNLLLLQTITETACSEPHFTATKTLQLLMGSFTVVHQLQLNYSDLVG